MGASLSPALGIRLQRAGLEVAWQGRHAGQHRKEDACGSTGGSHTWKLGERSNNLWALTWDRILYMIGLFAEDGFSDAEIANVQSAFKLVD